MVFLGYDAVQSGRQSQPYSTRESSSFLGRHNFVGGALYKSPFTRKLLYADPLHILWPLTGSNLNTLWKNLSKVVARSTTPMTVFITISGNVLLLIMMKF
jgi:hypothetical protein